MERGELAGDNQLPQDCRDKNRVRSIPRSPPMCCERRKRTLDPGYQRVQEDQEELKLPDATCNRRSLLPLVKMASVLGPDLKLN